MEIGARCPETRVADRLANTSELRAALRYCEGHLHRINGEALKSGARTPTRSVS